MRYLPLLLVSSIMAGADVPSLIAEHDKAVAALDAKLAKALIAAVKTAKDPDKPELYKLILKYDPGNEAAQQFVSAAGVGDKTDLLGGTIETITQVNAQLVVNGYKANKVTGKDWAGFPGKEFKLDNGNADGAKTGMKVRKGKVYLFAPNPDDKFQVGIGAMPMAFHMGDVFEGAIGVSVLDPAGLSLQTQFINAGITLTAAGDAEIVLKMRRSYPVSGSVTVKVLEVIP
jgi:hypothetical protein